MVRCLHLQEEGKVEEVMNQQDWEKKSREILTDIREWRQAHPKATFVEIEDEVHRRMMQLEAQVLQDAAQASSTQAWGRTKEQDPPRCPTCAVALQARGKHQRILQGNAGTSLTLTRTYGSCPTCGQSFFPSR